jgi:NTP pyrophosphatase (non-canonical NTP hydrolase)
MKIDVPVYMDFYGQVSTATLDIDDKCKEAYDKLICLETSLGIQLIPKSGKLSILAKSPSGGITFLGSVGSWAAAQRKIESFLGRAQNKAVPPLSFDEYQAGVERTFARRKDSMDATNAVMGLIGELGELTDVFKKIYFHKHQAELDGIIEELGDAFWYTSALLTTCGQKFSHIWEANVNLYHEDFALSDKVSLIKIKDAKKVLKLMTFLMQSALRIGSELSIPKIGREVSGETYFEFVALINGFKLLLHLLGIDVASVLEANRKKLQTRYPNGFNSEDSIKRVDVGK